MRLVLSLATLCSLAFFMSSAWAHGPTPQRLTLQADLAAAPEEVWAVVGDFSSVAIWHPRIAESPLDGDRERGAQRTLVFEGGGQVVEGIDDINETEMSYAYRLKREDIEVFPASFYSNTISVAPNGDGSRVTWRANFFRADTGNYPSEAQNDEAAVTAMKTFIEAGLEGLEAYLDR
ncbi:SRPBCC family protein [Algihabitans albus]|uniref:SRPBCC family protein n=1 Tax=Algihabitans albus TaxID=2164067 RepID=UPI001ABD0F5D|nr:SRPBCC family protein [Algihabitans albus]